MRISSELVWEISVVDQESRDPLASNRRFSKNFKDGRFKHHIYGYCKVFGVSNTVKILLLRRNFFIPYSVINPALCLNLNELNETDCKNYFCFGHSDIKTIVIHLQLSEVIIIPSHADQVLVIGALCLVLQRLSYPCHWFDLENQFGRHVSSLSCIFYYTMQFILQKVKEGALF
jgi:hypothetical protein